MTGYFHGLVSHHNISDTSVSDNAVSPAPWMAYALDLMNAQNATRAAEKRGTWNWGNTDKVSFIVVDRKIVPENVTEEAAIAHVSRASVTPWYALTGDRVEFK